jgi:threonine synthase
VQGIRAHASSVPIHPHPDTIALSIGDETAAAITLSTAYDSNGGGHAIPDAEIIAAMRLLAGMGLAAEPSGAAGVAAALSLQRMGQIGAEEDIVCIMTGSAVKWPDTIGLDMQRHELTDEDPKVVEAWVHAVDAAIEAGSPQTI